MSSFLDERRLLNGPWRAFEKDVARLLIQNGFDQVRIVGGSGDHGGDVVAVKEGVVWVIQCKFTSDSSPPPNAIEEVVNAASFYGARRLLVAASRPFAAGSLAECGRYRGLGFTVELLGPSELRALADRSPEYAVARRDLRPYQLRCAERLSSALRETGRGQLVLATGLGKTVVMAEVTAQLLRDGAVPGGRVLVLADKRELVEQLQRSFWEQLPKWVSTHALNGQEAPTYWEGITFATVQSVMSRLDELPPFGLVWVDEAHHIGSDSFRSVLGKLAPPMLGGVTATPWRGDQFDIDDLLGHPVERIGIEDGLREGFLCEADYRLLADNIDWELVKSRSKNRYSLGELNTRLILPIRDEEAARQIAKVFQDERRKSLIVFCPSVAHTVHFASILGLFGFHAASLTGETPPRDRDRLMTAFRAGRLNAITTVDIFNEGVDVPDCDMLAFMRVTHSRRIFVQQLGRGLRLPPGKSKVVVLDFVTDLRRIAEVIALKRAEASDVEKLDNVGSIVQFRDVGAGRFIYEWMKDQASLLSREDDPSLVLPAFNYPETPGGGNVQ
jgi:superfamily II DNA or RNA helicase